MARPRADRDLMPSLIDRLTDSEAGGSFLVQGYTPSQMMDAVRADLDALFNTHDPSGTIPPEFVELRRSIAAFGFPDLNSLSTTIDQQRDEVTRLIEGILARFEPRLINVRVAVAKPRDPDEARRVRFAIEAQLNVDPSPEVAFATVVELATGQASIRQGEG